MDQDHIKEILDRITNVKIAVYGDFCLDAYWIVDQKGSEISIETGLKTEAMSGHYYTPGGAGNVVTNLCALQPSEIKVIGVIGDDIFGRELNGQLQALGTDTNSLFVQKNSFDTYTYLKRLAGGKEEPRIDFGNFNKRSRETDQKLVHAIEAALQECDALVFNQQVTGSITNDAFLTDVNLLFEKYSHKVIIIDSRHYNHCFQNVCLKANDREILTLAKADPNDAKNMHDIETYGKTIFKRYDKPVFVTCGEQGMIAFDHSGQYKIPAVPVKGELDTVGAGDTVTSAVTLCLAAGISVHNAAWFANLAAAVTVQKLYTTGTATGEEILEISSRYES